MAKRSDGQFERRKNDYYPTFDPRAVKALLPHLEHNTEFIEPCAGAGDLVDQLLAAGHTCLMAYDVEPRRDDVETRDALAFKPPGPVERFITNPPWSRDLLHRLIVHLSDIAPTWLLFDADWKHTKQAAPYLNRLRKIVSVGRLKWIPGSKCDGKDNCAWYLFDTPGNVAPEFYGRAA